MNYIVKFTLLDGRGDSEQRFNKKEEAHEFYDWCISNPELVSNVTLEESKS